MSRREFWVDESGETCEHAGHEWVEAGGGLLICGVCQAERWATAQEMREGFEDHVINSRDGMA